VLSESDGPIARVLRLFTAIRRGRRGPTGRATAGSLRRASGDRGELVCANAAKHEVRSGIDALERRFAATLPDACTELDLPALRRALDDATTMRAVERARAAVDAAGEILGERQTALAEELSRPPHAAARDGAGCHVGAARW
jgi:hypothetical protein